MHALNFRRIAPIEAISDFADRVGLGEVEGYRRVALYGNNPSVTDTGDVWTGGGIYPWMTAATSLEVVSDSASDVGVVVLFQMLGASYNELPTLIALNGTTPVALPGQFFRCNGAIVVTAGAGQSTNVGTISLRDSAGGTVRAIIPAGRGTARQSAYTVPAGYKLAIRGTHGAINRDTGAAGTKVATIASWVRPPSGGAVVLPAEQPATVAWSVHNYAVPALLPEKTDTVLRVISTSHSGLDVTAGIMGYIKPNGSA
jgi:hypothetical protein